MTPKVIGAVAVLLIIITGILLSANRMDKTSDELMEYVQAAQDAFFSGDYEKSKEDIDRYISYIEDNKLYLCFVAARTQIHELAEIAHKAKACCAPETARIFISQLDGLKQNTEHLSESEQITVFTLI